MSAQIIRALTNRADALEAEAKAVESAETLEAAQEATGWTEVRDVHQLRFLAEEFRALAMEAQGYVVLDGSQ